MWTIIWKLKKLKQNWKKLKQNLKKLKKSGANTWHVLFKNVNYLNTISEKRPNWPKFEENDNLIEHKTKIETKLNKNNKNRDQMYI